MNINDCFPSRFLAAADLKGQPRPATIASVQFEAMGRTREVRPVVYFVGKEKSLKLNKTNAAALAELAGTPMTEQWAGLAVTLYPTSADFGGKSFPVVRIRAGAGRRLAPVPRSVSDHPVGILESEI